MAGKHFGAKTQVKESFTIQNYMSSENTSDEIDAAGGLVQLSNSNCPPPPAPLIRSETDAKGITFGEYKATRPAIQLRDGTFINGDSIKQTAKRPRADSDTTDLCEVCGAVETWPHTHANNGFPCLKLHFIPKETINNQEVLVSPEEFMKECEHEFGGEPSFGFVYDSNGFPQVLCIEKESNTYSRPAIPGSTNSFRKPFILRSETLPARPDAISRRGRSVEFKSGSGVDIIHESSPRSVDDGATLSDSGFVDPKEDEAFSKYTYQDDTGNDRFDVDRFLDEIDDWMEPAEVKI